MSLRQLIQRPMPVIGLEKLPAIERATVENGKQ